MSRRRTRRDDMASCRQVGRVLQSYLDGYADEITRRRVERHLEACRRCGLEAHVYEDLKAALARRSAHVDRFAIERLRGFARGLIETPPAVSGPAS
jgi:anti-sigma factor RsiW